MNAILVGPAQDVVRSDGDGVDTASRCVQVVHTFHRIQIPNLKSYTCEIYKQGSTARKKQQHKKGDRELLLSRCGTVNKNTAKGSSPTTVHVRKGEPVFFLPSANYFKQKLHHKPSLNVPTVNLKSGVRQQLSNQGFTRDISLPPFLSIRRDCPQIRSNRDLSMKPELFPCGAWLCTLFGDPNNSTFEANSLRQVVFVNTTNLLQCCRGFKGPDLQGIRPKRSLHGSQLNMTDDFISLIGL